MKYSLNIFNLPTLCAQLSAAQKCEEIVRFEKPSAELVAYGAQEFLKLK